MNPKDCSAVSRCVVAVAFFFLLGTVACTVSYDHVRAGFSTSAIRSVDVNGFFLHSVNDTFALGFNQLGTGPSASYYLCIMHLSSEVIVWTANSNNPVGLSDLLYFKTAGNLTLTNSQGVAVWSTDTVGGSVLQLRETGNLVVLDDVNKILWESFAHPTDTLLSGQKFYPGMLLTGSRAELNVSYYLSMNSTLQLYVNSSLPQIYWSMAQDGKTNMQNSNGVAAYATIDSSSKSLGLFASDGSVLSSIVLDSYDLPTIRRAILDEDGNLAVYYIAGSLWNLAFKAVRDECNLPDVCGGFGLCSNNGQCSCPENTNLLNETDASQGCTPKFVPSCSGDMNALELTFINLGSVTYYADEYAQPQYLTSNLSKCLDWCKDNCSCTAFFYHNDTGSCFLWPALGSIKQDSNPDRLGFLKTIRNDAPGGSHSSKRGGTSFVIILIALATACVIVSLCLVTWWLHKRRLRARRSSATAEDDELMEAIPGLPTRFSYRDLEVATNRFSHKLGSGGFGSVYEGLLPDKSKIAVKRLESVGQGKKEFWAEVATIGSIHHVHLVRLRGFCAEGLHRLLVYEFMAKGSLDQLLFTTGKDGVVLDWETRCNICLATAQGLAYLHEDCRERIIHCDIKPENILLDENFNAKVSDFGLAKLMNREQSQVFTTLRGTRGYLAPEWLMNFAISDKSDVYSFGMVLLELISGRKNFDPTETSEKWYFPIYAYRQAEVGRVNVLADPRLKGLVNEDQVTKLTRIALWCIQDEVGIRPSMRKVVKMIEGIIEVPNPPSSPQLAVRLHGRKYDTSGTNESGISFNSGDISASHLSGPR